MSVSSNPKWEAAVRKRGAQAGDVIDCVMEYVSHYQEGVSKSGGDVNAAIIDLLFLEDLDESELVLELAGRLFLVKVTLMDGEDATAARLRSIHDTEQQDAALADPGDVLTKLLRLAGRKP